MTETNPNRRIYTGFAEGYDLVMRDVDFEAWALHVLSLTKHHGFRVKRILNAACGTAAAEGTWLEAGIEVVGFDLSEEMVEVARQKFDDSAKVRFLAADMRTFDLEGDRFDLVTCLYDSLNYLTEPSEVQAFFKNAARHLKKGGAFIFDVATESNILENFTAATYAENFEDFAYIWDNEYNIETKLCTSDFAFFYREAEDKPFTRREETHTQRMYTVRDLSRWVKASGFELLGSYDGFSLRPPKTNSDRIHFVARKV